MSAPPLPPVLLVGGGRMGGALLAGWLERGMEAAVVVEPQAAAAAALAALDPARVTVVAAAGAVPAGFAPAAAVLAVKPQQAGAALAGLGARLAGALVVSIMAGRAVAGLRALLGAGAGPVVRAMPNTPAAVGRGFTAAFAPPGTGAPARALADRLLAAVGEVAWVDAEGDLDAVTAVSGGGPAYVFLLAELLEGAALAQGLSPDLARRMARCTVAGSGALLEASAEDAAALRRAVTSPGGTTERALAELMAEGAWPAAMARAIAAATARSRELAG